MALKALGSKGYDVVLLDLHLHDVIGMDNIVAIKEQCPEMPIVVLSGVDSDAQAIDALEQGAQEYLIKGHSNGKVLQMAIHSSIKRKSVERRLFRQANYDELTGLPNRRLFKEHIEKALCRAERWSRHEIILFIDIDNFKTVNDTYGHEVGNKVLREAAMRMQRLMRHSDMVARYGGDEFIISLDEHSADYRSAAGHAATKLLYAFNEPFLVDQHSIECSVSIGAAIYPLSGQSFTSLIEQADNAMFLAKKDGGRQFRFAPLNQMVKLA